MVFALLANPAEHFHTDRQKKINQIVLHLSSGLVHLKEQGDDHSAHNINRHGASVVERSSWHKCVDSAVISDGLPDAYVALHCTGYNGSSLGLMISNRDGRWDNKPHRWMIGTLYNAAQVTLKWEQKFQIPRRLLSKEEVDAGAAGYVFHSELDRQCDDPDFTFPWEQFLFVLDNLDHGYVAGPPAPPVDEELRDVLHVETVEQLERMRQACVSQASTPSTLEPFDIEEVQAKIGTTIDGVWDSKSQAALHWWIRLYQTIVEAPPTGVWDIPTEQAYWITKTNQFFATV